MRRVVLGAAVLAAVMLGGCDAARDAQRGPAGGAVQIGAGTEPVAWSSWIYRDKAGLLCLEVRDGGGSVLGGGCSSGIGPSMANGDPGVVVGGTQRPDGTRARVVFPDRDPVTVDLVQPAPGVTSGVRYFTVLAADAPLPERIEILDASGEVVEDGMHPAWTP